jgi:hypothetical protein
MNNLHARPRVAISYNPMYSTIVFFQINHLGERANIASWEKTNHLSLAHFPQLSWEHHCRSIPCPKSQGESKADLRATGIERGYKDKEKPIGSPLEIKPSPYKVTRCQKNSTLVFVPER